MRLAKQTRKGPTPFIWLAPILKSVFHHITSVVFCSLLITQLCHLSMVDPPQCGQHNLVQGVAYLLVGVSWEVLQQCERNGLHGLMDDGRTLRLQNHRLEQPAEQTKGEARENTVWVNVHSTDSLGRMCVPDGMQSVSRVCFFYRVNMDREQSSHHTRLYSNVHRVIHVYRYWPCSRHTSTCMRPGREVRNLKPFWLILGRKKGDTEPLQCLLLGVWIVH